MGKQSDAKVPQPTQKAFNFVPRSLTLEEAEQPIRNALIGITCAHQPISKKCLDRCVDRPPPSPIHSSSFSPPSLTPGLGTGSAQVRPEGRGGKEKRGDAVLSDVWLLPSDSGYSEGSLACALSLKQSWMWKSIPIVQRPELFGRLPPECCPVSVTLRDFLDFERGSLN